jgi:putative hydrolase of the HAD superfamily
MPIKAVLFDMFETLLLGEKEHKYYLPSLVRMHKFLNEQRIEVSFDKFYAAYVKARDRLRAEAKLNFEEPHFYLRVAETLKSLGYKYDVSSPIIVEATSEFCEEFMNFVRIDENAEAMLKCLHGKYKLGIICNYPIPECVDKMLQANHLAGLFDKIVVSGAVNKRKPDPEIFLSILKALDVSASETVFVGDTVEDDIEGPKAVGMKTVYIERRVQEFKKVYPDQTIKSLSELPLALERC